jgi:zinc transporter 7
MHEQSQKAAESTTTDSDFLAGWSFKSRAKLNAVLATLLVSVAPVFILPLIPIDHTPERQPLLKVLLSFAVGGLLSDVFLHLIPHALSSGSGEGGHSHGHSHSHSHSHGGDGGEEEGGDLSLTVGLGVLAGLLTFFVVEKFVRSRHGGGGHGHSHGAKPAQEKKTKGGNEKEKKLNKKEKKQRESVEEGIKVGGFLNLAADMTHNFTDGLAIASSFLVSTPVGVTTTVAVLVHEIPHEIGDFAILLQSGFSRRQAMAAQFATAVGAFLGCLLGVLLEHGLGNTTHYILPFTAGGFIYIATVDVLPDLLQDSSFKQTFKEVFAFLVGVGLMVAVAQYEESM